MTVPSTGYTPAHAHAHEPAHAPAPAVMVHMVPLGYAIPMSEGQVQTQQDVAPTEYINKGMVGDGEQGNRF